MAKSITPPRGGKPDKLIRDALMLALNREAADADGKKTKKLNLIADKLIEKAIGGDVAAIKEIADRVDGKAVQPLAHSGADGESPVAHIIEMRAVYPKK